MGEKKTKDKSKKTKVFYIFAVQLSCPDGGIGRRAGLKHQWQQCCAGSIPAPGTEKEETDFFCFFFFSHIKFW